MLRIGWEPYFVLRAGYDAENDEWALVLYGRRHEYRSHRGFRLRSEYRITFAYGRCSIGYGLRLIWPRFRALRWAPETVRATLRRDNMKMEDWPVCERRVSNKRFCARDD